MSQENVELAREMSAAWWRGDFQLRREGALPISARRKRPPPRRSVICWSQWAGN